MEPFRSLRGILEILKPHKTLAHQYPNGHLGILRNHESLANVKAIYYMIQIDISKSEMLKSMTSELLVKPCENEGS